MLLAGGTDGIGFALLRHIVEQKAAAAAAAVALPSKIFVLGRGFGRVDSFLSDDAALVERSGVRIVSLMADVRETASIAAAIARIDTLPLTHVVNTIGTFSKAPVLATANTEALRRSLEVNVLGNVELTRALLPLMLPDDGSASIATMIVLSATLVDDPRATYSTQACTKAAFAAFLKALQAEQPRLRLTLLYAPSLATGVFAKGGSPRDLAGYPSPSIVAPTIVHLLALPPCLSVAELTLATRR